MDKKYTAILLAAGNSQRLAELTKNLPKSFLKLGEKKIIEYNLEHISKNNIQEIIMVVGYKKELFKKEFGTSFKGIDIKYAVTDDYINTDNGYSLFITKSSWEENKNHVLVIDADMYFQKGLLKKVIDSESESTTLVEAKNKGTIEEMVLGLNGKVSGFLRTDGNGIDNLAGEQAGITKLSSEFIDNYYNYSESFFKESGYNQKYERVFDHVVRERGLEMDYIEVGSYRWININKVEDYEKAKNIYKTV